MTGLERGDVVLVWFPNSDLITFKQRPALVVEANHLGTGLPASFGFDDHQQPRQARASEPRGIHWFWWLTALLLVLAFLFFFFR